MEKSVKSEIYFYLRGVKSIEQLKRVIVKELTHGNAFLYIDQPEYIAEAKAKAEQLAEEMIQRNLEAIPKRIKQGYVSSYSKTVGCECSDCIERFKD